MIPTNKRVVLYARFSSDNQRSESIDAQIRAMTSFCIQHKLTIINTYIDEAKSATTDRRPAFQQMIADSSSRTFDIVLVHKLDRFARNRYDSAVYKRELKKHRVTVFSVLENLDDSPESIMLESVLEGMNEYYSQNLARETMKGLRETALQCKHTGGVPPLGYDVDPITKKLVINEHEAEAVRLIYNMYANGYGYTAIIDALNEGGYTTKAGTVFHKNSLHSILLNKKYQGIYIFNRAAAKSPDGKRNNHLSKDPKDIIIIKDGCPRIIGDNVAEKARQRQAKRYTVRTGTIENYLLTGKIRCKECGKTMTGCRKHSGRNKTLLVTYRCVLPYRDCKNKEINKVYLDNYVIRLLEQEIFNPLSLKLIEKQLKHQRRHGAVNRAKDIERIDHALTQTSEALKNVADAISAGLLSDALITKLNELEKQKLILENEKTLLLSQDDPALTEIDYKGIISEYKRLKDTPAFPEYKTFIHNFIEQVTVGRYSVDITLKNGLDLFPALNKTYTVRRKEIYEQQKGR